MYCYKLALYSTVIRCKIRHYIAHISFGKKRKDSLTCLFVVSRKGTVGCRTFFLSFNFMCGNFNAARNGTFCPHSWAAVGVDSSQNTWRWILKWIMFTSTKSIYAAVVPIMLFIVLCHNSCSFSITIRWLMYIVLVSFLAWTGLSSVCCNR